MARSPKIRKKKSFMFTTKHHSFNGIMGVVICAFAAAVLITSVMFAFRNRGEVAVNFGYYGFLSALLCVIGMIGGFLGIKERDTFPIAPWVAMIGNGIVLAAWIVMILLSKAG